MKVVVVGAGLGGLAAGLALARQGHAVVVYERAEALTEVGAGVQLSPNAVKALRRLGVDRAVGAHAVRPEAIEVRRGRGDALLARSALGDAVERRYGAPYWHASRADLHAALAEAAGVAGVELRLGSVVSVPPKDVDLIVAADGVRSSLREIVFGGGPPQFTGQVAWRGTVPLSALPEGTQPPVVSVRVGAGRHFVSYRVAGGAAVNFVGVVEQAEWPGERWSEPGDQAALARDFAGWPQPVQAIIRACAEPGRWAILDREPAAEWVQGRTVLLGDAAHPVPPFLAQGAALALEDAVVLARRLAETADVDAALAAYAAERRPRAARVLRASRRNAFAYHAGGLTAIAGQTALAVGSRLAPGLLTASLDWLYGFEP